jgi:hypothetical protein
MTSGTAAGLRQRKYGVLLALLCIALAIEMAIAPGAERVFSDAFNTILAFAIWFVRQAAAWRAGGPRAGTCGTGGA